tara:strand:- start:959 stop:1159 length:201 start_codon:yes stop_codon:yes gene_type:complete
MGCGDVIMNIETVKKVNDPRNNELMCYEITITNIDSQISVPHNEENRHYQAILKWVAEGNTIEEAD